MRLVLAIRAGALVGYNRGEKGHPVGLRTTLLVCLAAAIAMMQANLLLHTTGKTPDSFNQNGLMRLPLGILSGMGFIGVGAILRRGSMVRGVTTTATLWIVTVIGLCFGGGQIGLGLGGLCLTLIILWWLKAMEARLTEEHTARLTLTVQAGIGVLDEVAAHLSAEGFRTLAQTLKISGTLVRKQSFSVTWRARRSAVTAPLCLKMLASLPAVMDIEWVPAAFSPA
ncbi:MAG TPA: MgtC/SapB family protein [Xanthobacteraceae bacterium]